MRSEVTPCLWCTIFALVKTNWEWVLSVLQVYPFVDKKSKQASFFHKILQNMWQLVLEWDTHTPGMTAGTLNGTHTLLVWQLELEWDTHTSGMTAGTWMGHTHSWYDSWYLNGTHTLLVWQLVLEWDTRTPGMTAGTRMGHTHSWYAVLVVH
jgi:hypothetical protein